MSMVDGREEQTLPIRGGGKLLIQLKPFCETLHRWRIVQLLQLSGGIQIMCVLGIMFYFTESWRVLRGADNSINR